ncbi:MAG: hypothetical protein GY870_06920 [archaeon]|nr:hypothetical protein [archaeon]
MAITTINIGGRNIKVDTSIADRLKAANQAKITATGTPIKINEGMRTTERQAALYAKSQAGEIGRAAPPGQSFHETGRAIDVADFEESQQFLNRVGLRNDLAGDKGHFSLGETQTEKYTSFAESIEKGRQRGFTDTELLDVFVQKNPDAKKSIETAKQRYDIDDNIKNDKDLVNFLALRYSGVGRLKTPSVPIKKEITFKEDAIEDIKETGKGIFASVKERFTSFIDVFKKAGKGEISLLEARVQSKGQIAGLINDVAGESFIGIGKLLVSDKVEENVKEDFMLLLEETGAAEALSKGSAAWEEFKVNNPASADNIAAGANVAALGLDLIGLKGTGKVTKKVINEATDLAVKGGKVAGKVGEEAAEKGRAITKFGVSQATGLAPETIEQVIKNPDKFTREAIKAVDRDTLAKSVIGKIEGRIEALKDTGQAYTAIRRSGATVDITPNFIQDTLKTKYGLDIVDGKIKASTKSVTRNANDIKAIQNILDDWGTKTAIDADEFLNLRSDLADLAKFDATKTKASQTVAKGLRAELNSKFRKQIDGLEELDKVYAEETKVLTNIKKDFFKKDGKLKDNAVSKIANLTGKGKEQTLERLKGLVPDIEEQVNILKAIEDINAAGGQKVGAYSRTVFTAGGALTGNVPVMIGSILLTPKIAVEALRAYGKLKNIAKELIEKIISKIKKGEKLVGKEAEVFEDMINEEPKVIKKLLKK